VSALRVSDCGLLVTGPWMGDLRNAGAHLIWMLDPELRTAVVIRAEGGSLILGEDGDGILSGFTHSLRDMLV
jgi:hypothetical protein